MGFETWELPFPTERLYEQRNRAIRKKITGPFASVVKQNPFLEEYLMALPRKLGVPDYYEKPSRSLKDLDEPNLIYAIGGGLFVHIYPNPRGERDWYIAIEPHMTVQFEHLMPEVELRLLDYTEEIGMAETEEAKREAIQTALDSILSTKSRGNSGGIKVSEREFEALQYYILREKAGGGVLAPLLLDPNIEDISCSGTGAIFLEHKIFKSIQCSIAFEDSEHLDAFVIWMGEWIKQPVTVRNPIVDSVLPDGSRINIVFGTDISKRGSNFTIRKFNETPLSVLQLIDFGTLNYQMASYLSFLLEEGMNMFVAGATASGKTTLLNAITTFILPENKIVTIEDTPELQVPHKNWIREQTRFSGKADQAGVGMFDLLKAALRQRPERIIVGEIRGEEGAIAFQAMQTGHGVMSTFHAASVQRLIQRLTGEPINIPKAYVDNLDCVIIQAATRAPGIGMVRRVMSINEIIGYDSVSQSFSFVETFKWNQAKDVHDFPGYMNSFVLEEKIAMRRGIPHFKRKAIYTELKRRARIFERIHKERGVTGFHEFFEILAEAHKQNLL